jgi:hypothetical protein
MASPKLEKRLKLKTEEDLKDKMKATAGADIPKVETTLQEVQSDELLGEDSGQLGQFEDAPVALEGSMDGLTTTAPTKPGADVGQVDTTTTTEAGLEELGPAEAAQLDRTDPYMDIVQGELSEGAIAEAATEELDVRGTVQYQLGELMGSLESGGPMPPWASPQVRKVNAIMQQRGLGASSMASAAMTTALMESGIQIAAKDADKYSAIQLQNLNNKQQTALQNAATIATMDTANLNARLQSEVTNAKAFLSIDLANLDNQQKSDTLTYQSQVEGLFKDAAEDNARKQFNAKNELQVEEFFAELGAQVATANANRAASMEQFNVSEANTALQNETNRINVQNEYNANQNALNNLWQAQRDNAQWNFTKGENALAREHDMAINAMNFANSNNLYSKKQKDDLAKNIGKWLGKLF